MAIRKTEAASGAALLDLMVEVTRAFFRLRAAGRELGAVDAAGGGRWGFLRSLRLEGPQTVPQLARSRPVARQYVQTMANALAAEGLIEFVDNPAHRRSRLMRLTRKGERVYDAINARVVEAARRLAREFDAADVATARDVLKRLAPR
jgi:DNA-binding MarR family transcriptional regulator